MKFMIKLNEAITNFDAYEAPNISATTTDKITVSTFFGKSFDFITNTNIIANKATHEIIINT